MNVFGKKLKALRGQYGLTQKDLAESMGTTKGTVAKWEQGVRYPELATLPGAWNYISRRTGDCGDKDKNPRQWLLITS